MPKLRNAFLCLAAIPAIALAQNSSSVDLLNFVTSDAQVLAGANVTAAKNSPFGQFVLSQMQMGESNFETFLTATGFDPRTDLSEVLIASNGAHAGTDPLQGNSSRVLIAAHGTFSHAIATLEGSLVNDGANVVHLSGVDVITLPAANGPVPGGCIAFFTDGATAMMGDCAIVNAAAQSKGAKSGAPSALAGKARQWRTSTDLWFTSVIPLTQFAAFLPTSGPLTGMMNTDLFKGIQQMSGGVKFASSNAQGPAIQVSGEVLMDTAQNATALLNVVNFISGMIKMLPANDPAATMFAGLLATLQASASGNTVSVSLTIPEGTLEQIFISGPHMAMVR
jgi:hypothetical protein